MTTASHTTESEAVAHELTSAEAFELAAAYCRYGLDRLATEAGPIHPGVRPHAIAALT
jgi:hypothetical protein